MTISCSHSKLLKENTVFTLNMCASACARSHMCIHIWYIVGLSISNQLKIIAIKTYHSVWVNKVQNNSEGTEWNWTPMLHSHLRYGDFISFRFVSKQVFMHTLNILEFTITLYANQYEHSYKSNIKQATIDSSLMCTTRNLILIRTRGLAWNWIASNKCESTWKPRKIQLIRSKTDSFLLSMKMVEFSPQIRWKETLSRQRCTVREITNLNWMLQRKRDWWRWWDASISMRLRRSTAFYLNVQWFIAKWHKRNERENFPLRIEQITFDSIVRYSECTLEDTEWSIEHMRSVYEMYSVKCAMCIASAFYRNQLICVLCDFANDLWFPVLL